MEFMILHVIFLFLKRNCYAYWAMLDTIIITYNKTIYVLIHACVYYDLESKKNELTSRDFEFAFYLCVLLLLLVLVLGFRFMQLGLTLNSAKQDLEFPILLLLPSEWILRLWVYSQPVRCDFFLLLLLFACFIGTGDIKLSYPPLRSPKGLWNKTSDCLQVACLWEGGLHVVLRSFSFFWGKLTFNSSLSRGDWSCHWSLFRKISFPWILKEVWKKQRKYLNWVWNAEHGLPRVLEIGRRR